MGDVLAFGPRRGAEQSADHDDVTLHRQGRAVVAFTADGRVTWATSLDEASRAVWDAVEGILRHHWEETQIPRLRRQVRLLASLLDDYDPDWRDRARSR